VPKTLTGNLDTFSLADLLQWLEINALSGRLTVTRGDVKRTIDLQKGSIIYVSSSRPDERLGVFLANRGLLPETVLYDLLAENYVSGSYLTRLILDRSLLPREKLATAVESLAMQVLLDLFHWRGARFEFDPLAKTVDLLNIHLSLRGQVLAIHGAKSVDDSARMHTSSILMEDREAAWEKEFHQDAVVGTFWSLLEAAQVDGVSPAGMRDRFYVFNLFAGELHRLLAEPITPFPIFDDTAAMLQTVLQEGGEAERLVQIAALDPFLTADILYLANSLEIDPSSLFTTARLGAEVIGDEALRKYTALLSGPEAPKLRSGDKMERTVRRAALSTAVAASHVSQTYSWDAEEAYTLGLLEPLPGFELLKVLINVDFPPGPLRAGSLERYRPLFGRVLAQKLNLPLHVEAVLGSEGRVTAGSPVSEQLIYFAKHLVPGDQIGREWTSEDPELADRYHALCGGGDLAGNIARDAGLLREILNL